jgi:nucleoid-associated protein YgaU
MTRETKIGLLVGLAFIIVIGILLSDHMTSTNDPPKAPLSVAGSNLRESVVTPAGPAGSAAAAAVAGTTAGQTPVTPTQTVLTEAELAARQRAAAAAAQVIQVGPGVAAQQPPVVVQQGPVAAQPQLQSRIQIPAPAPAQPQQNPVQLSQGGVTTAPPQRPADSPVVIAPPAAQPGVNQTLQQLAGRHGEEIVPIGTAPAGNAPRPQGVPMAPVREYKAQAGDSLSKMAARFLGSSNKASREAIVRMNPSLQQNPDKIVEGRTYVLPPAPAGDTSAAAPAPATPAPAAPVTPAPAPAAPETAAAPASGTFTWYTVKENENLWKIASEQLGSGNAWTQIRDLNQDILKGDDRLRVNAKIRLPNKPVASAAH